MLLYMALGVVLLFGLIRLAQWFVRADAATVLRAAKWAGAVGIGLLVLWFAASGRFGVALAVAGMLAPWIWQAALAARAARNQARLAGAPSGQSSTVKTRFLEVSLAHDSGVVAGAVIDGPFAGRDLSDLSTVEMAELLHLCRREDPSSAQVLEAYLDRCRPGWRKDDQGSWGEEDAVGAPADPGVMTRAEALRILGLAEGATEDEIRRAYHHLIASLHPDLGGSAFLAAQVNRARDVLLGR